MSSRAKRLAANEALFREVNENVHDVHSAWTAIAPGRGALRIVCECSDDSCVETIDVTPELYRSVREHRERFLLLTGHDDPTIERIVDAGDSFAVVEKTGAGADVVRKL